MDIISRAAWGARKPDSRSTVAWSKRTEFVVHWSAGPNSQTPRQIQNFHMDDRNWSDIGYNFLVDTRGRIYEGRGWTVIGAHATGHNTSGIGVCLIGRAAADATPAARAAIRWLYDEACRRAGRALARRGHRDVGSTACPGDELHAWVRKGMPTTGTPPRPPSPPKPSRPAPGPVVAFPLPGGHYFGPASGPDQSVSGKYGRTFKGKTDRAWLQEWTNQLARRGWSIGKGRTWLPKYGNDGQYGPEYDDLVRAFQRDQGLTVDGELGPKTWDAAYKNPVT